MAKPVPKTSRLNARVKVNDRAWKQITRRVNKFKRATARAGILADKGAKPHSEGGHVTVAQIMTWHEYGDPKSGLRERSWLRKTMADRRDAIVKMQSKLGSLVLRGKLDAYRALDILGNYVAGEIKRAIIAGRVGGPRLRPSTIKAKGSSKKLIDKGIAVNSVTHEVMT